MDNWKESVRQDLGRLPKWLKLSEVAKAAGLEPGQLYQFGSKGVINADALRALDAWLTAEGYRQAGGGTGRPETAVAAVVPADFDDAARVLADELRNLADLICSPAFEKRTKVERFFRRISEIYEFKEALAAALCKDDEGAV